MASLGMIAVVAGLGLFLLQDQPALTQSGPPTPQDVAAARQFLHEVRAVTGDTPRKQTPLQTDVAQLNSALRLGARIIDGFRGRVTVDGPVLVGEGSVPVPWWNGRKWLNVAARVPEFEGRMTPSRVTIGGHDVPPALALFVARVGANLALGNRLGDTVLQAASEMKISGQTLTFALTLDEMGKNGVMQGTFGAMRGSDMPSADMIDGYHRLIRTAIAEGQLPQSGSLLPYLQFTLQAALNSDAPDPLPQRYTAAVLGLAKACGAEAFADVMGRLVFDSRAKPQTWAGSCAAVTLNGRIDSRRHFVTSAALQAASNTGFAISIGEFKELHDTISGAGGFDFTDLAANLSGVRLSDVFMAQPADQWPVLLDQINTESDIIIAFEGIPGLMPQAAFNARFGDVDSAAYAAMLAQIAQRIDALPPYRAISD